MAKDRLTKAIKRAKARKEGFDFTDLDDIVEIIRIQLDRLDEELQNLEAVKPEQADLAGDGMEAIRDGLSDVEKALYLARLDDKE